METQLPSGSVQLQRSFAAGVVTSPNYPGLYSDRLVMKDKIGVDQGLVIVVQLTDFETERGRQKMGEGIRSWCQTLSKGRVQYEGFNFHSSTYIYYKKK